MTLEALAEWLGRDRSELWPPTEPPLDKIFTSNLAFHPRLLQRAVQQWPDIAKASHGTNHTTLLHQLCSRCCTFWDRSTRAVCDDFSLDAAADAMRSLIDARANVNARDASGFTPLLWLVPCDTQLLEVLVSYGGANVNKKNLRGSTPLHLVCRTPNLACSRWLLAHGAKIRKNIFLRTPLHTCCLRQQLSSTTGMHLPDDDFGAAFVDLLSQYKYAVPETLDALDGGGDSPLLLAIGFGMERTVRALCQAGASVHTTSRASPMHQAVGRNHLEIVRTLVEHGACVHAVPLPVPLDETKHALALISLSRVAVHYRASAAMLAFLQQHEPRETQAQQVALSCSRCRLTDQVQPQQKQDAAFVTRQRSKCANPGLWLCHLCCLIFVWCAECKHAHDMTFTLCKLPTQMDSPSQGSPIGIVTAVRTKKCSRCRSVEYCSTDCQRAHWPVHKKACFVTVSECIGGC